MPLITCYANPRKVYSRMVCEALAAGCGGTVAYDYVPREGIAFVLGMDENARRLIRASEDWYQIDHGYFGRMNYFRITHRGLWTDGRGRADHKRLERLRLPIRIRKAFPLGDVVLAIQTPAMYQWYGLDSLQWVDETVARCQRHTHRAILLRHKPVRQYRNAVPFPELLRTAWAVVCHSSGAAIEALIEGVPVVVTEQAFPAARLGIAFGELERPRVPTVDERRDLFARLAAQQWSIDEMAAGITWRELNDGAR